MAHMTFRVPIQIAEGAALLFMSEDYLAHSVNILRIHGEGVERRR